MKKKSTSLLFAVAAFAVTATSVQAFASHEFLTNAGLSDDQVVAIQEARELRKAGDIDAARDALLEAGIDEETIKELRQAHREHRKDKREERRAQVAELLTDEQRDALQVAREANDRETVKAILEEAGIDVPHRGHKRQQN